MSFHKYADIIIDISHENLDKTYQYWIPEEYSAQATIGAPVKVSFGRGNRIIDGYIIGLSDEAKIDIDKIKPITEVVKDATVIESHLIYLAHWIKESFGGTMNEALKTVIPVKKVVKAVEEKRLILNVDIDKANDLYNEYNNKSFKARVRLLEALIKDHTIDYAFATSKLNISRSTINDLVKLGVIKLETKEVYRNPINQVKEDYQNVVLNDEQQYIVDNIIKDYIHGIRSTYLIHGITGSGKTEVYMEVIAHVIAGGKQVILLIPEIALTYQTVQRFHKRFGDRVSILNSRMSGGERYDQSLRAKNKEIDLIIGPRSALFTPFSDLGLIIIDEEHETSYKSETTPKYNSVDVARMRAQLTDSSVILGSATPSLESYSRAMTGEYSLFTINKRAKEAVLPKVWIADLREELKNKNKSIFSEKLKSLIADRLAKKEQIMLFLNRRGYAGFVSCRSCGHVMKCPHCDISLTSHYNGRLVCHYCGYDEYMPKVCPTCGSKYIAAFGTGTQKVEELVKREFPEARVLRMDTDTTRKKGSYSNILSQFAAHKADILVGTQMIVKGHDFPMVTLVGIIAADLSLHVGDFRASERTFQLLCQAAGRAGRDVLSGEVVIQTYNPEHFSIITAADGDYESFYRQEMLYREMMDYPPAAHMLLVLISSKDEKRSEDASILLGEAIKDMFINEEIQGQLIGPAAAVLSKVKDYYRRVIYIKHKDYATLIDIKNYLEGYINYTGQLGDCSFQFDFDPINTY